ncbi:MAG: AraC family transcriptional regulator [Clostridia bacterium]|nr:AraC family transcriptional regulator [Clostridia bacterium]
MFKDEFKLRYKTIPFATFSRNHLKKETNEDVTSLSHRHREVELLAITGGRARFYINAEVCDVEDGDVVIISPYLMHNATIFANEDFKHYCLCFDLSIIPDDELRYNLEKGIVKIRNVVKADSNASDMLKNCIVNAFNAHKEGLKGWELKVKGNMALFFGLLAENGFIQKTVKNEGVNDICCGIIDYIEKNYANSITSTDAAKAFYVSDSYFCRIFKKNFGYCFQNYICMYRVEKAKILLRTTTLPVSAISMQTGFNSFSYFGKMFKEYIGVSPSEYRKKKDLIG